MRAALDCRILQPRCAIVVPPRQSDDVSLADSLSREFLLYHRLGLRELAPDGTVIAAAADGALLDALDEGRVRLRTPRTGAAAASAEVER